MKTLVLPGEPVSGWLVLIGGGEFSFGETDEIDRFLLEKMPAGNRRIAFIPTASGSPDYARHLGEYFRKLDSALEVTNVPVYRSRDLRRGRNLEAIRSAGMVYLGGGITNLVADTLRGTATEAAIREASAGGAVVAGIGAGAAVFGEYAADAQRQGNVVPGFGWIPGAAVETNYRPDASETLKRMMSAPRVTIGLGIPVSTAVAIAPDRTATILGDGQVAVVRRPGA